MFKSDRKTEVESVMSLKRCVLRDEGTKQGKSLGRGKVRISLRMAEARFLKFPCTL